MSAPLGRPKESSLPLGGKARSAKGAHDTSGPMSAAELSRLKWRCRRGMLENDLILARFMESRGAGLTQDEVRALDRLLALTDNAVWDLLSRRAEPDDLSIIAIVTALREVRVADPTERC